MLDSVFADGRIIYGRKIVIAVFAKKGDSDETQLLEFMDRCSDIYSIFCKNLELTYLFTFSPLR